VPSYFTNILFYRRKIENNREKERERKWRVKSGGERGGQRAATMTMSKLIRRNHIKTSTRHQKQGARTQDSGLLEALV